jgi:hypothetical protein
MSGPNFTATIDFTQVDRGLAETAKRSEGAVLSYGKLETQLNRTEIASKRLGSYMQQQFVPQFAKLDDGLARSTKGFWNLEGGAKALQQRLAPQAAAISGISAALGENAGQAGKAVAGLGQLAAAYAAGGPWGAILAAAGVGATLLVKYWDDVIVKQDEALMKAYSGVDAASALRQKAEADIAALRNATLNPARAAYEAVELEITAVEQRIANAKDTFKKNAVDESTLSAAMNPRKRQEIIDAQKEMKKNYDVEIVQLQKTVDLLRTKQGLQSARASTGTLPKGATTKTDTARISDIGLYELTNVVDPQIADNTAILESLRRPAFNQADAEDEKFNARFRAEAEFSAEIIQMVEEREKEIAAIEAKRVEQTSQMLASGVTRFATLTADLAVGALQGKKDGFQEFLKAASEEAGGYMILEGGKVLATGFAGALTGNPAAPLQLAGGAALVAAGAAVQKGGPAAVTALFGGGGGGGGGSGPTSRGATERGTGAGVRGGGGAPGGGGFTVNIMYAAAGPAPEQTGRVIVESLRTLNSRQGIRPARQGPSAR